MVQKSTAKNTLNLHGNITTRSSSNIGKRVDTEEKIKKLQRKLEFSKAYFSLVNIISEPC
jgi:hypothetical protein